MRRLNIKLQVSKKWDDYEKAEREREQREQERKRQEAQERFGNNS